MIDPTRASKPAIPTYGKPARGYGQNQSAVPSSVGVTDSASLSDLSMPKDDALDSLQTNGHGDQSGENSAVADLQRKIDTTGYPAAHGMAKRGADSGSPGGTIPATIGATASAPVRDPSA